ncbi:hypothetical protein GCM10027347_46730 [Larkinella harenae]
MLPVWRSRKRPNQFAIHRGTAQGNNSGRFPGIDIVIRTKQIEFIQVPDMAVVITILTWWWCPLNYLEICRIVGIVGVVEIAEHLKIQRVVSQAKSDERIINKLAKQPQFFITTP